ncbi:MAG: NAD-dependent malic enzyme [Candidatus Binatia bacterium]
MDPESSHGERLTRRLRLSLPNVSGALSAVTAAVSEAGGIVHAIQSGQENSKRRVVELDLLMISQEQFAAIRNAIQQIDGVLIEGEPDLALDAHRGGVITVQAKAPFRSEQDFAAVYAPGAARVAQAIARTPTLVHSHTAVPRLVALITNGTAVLGLGNIGPRAAMPVLESKAVLLDTCVMISGVPILLDTADPQKIIETLLCIAPTFAAICLEGIAAPVCFAVEDSLLEAMQTPVWHDDQHGVAVVVLAALLTLARRFQRSLNTLRIGLVGLGPSGIGIVKLLRHCGVEGVLGADDQAEARVHHLLYGGQPAAVEEVMEAAEVVIATGGAPGSIPPELVRRGQIIFALSEPAPEITPDVALAAGARCAVDGRTLTSALAFPGLLRGALDARLSRFTDSMKLAAAAAIARRTKAPALVPAVLDPVLHLRVAQAVQDVARREEALVESTCSAPPEKELSYVTR